MSAIPGPIAGPSTPHQELAVDPSPSSSNTPRAENPMQSPVVIGGIAAAGSALVALMIWMGWVVCRAKRSKRRRRSADDEGRGRPELPRDWHVVADNFNRAKSPQQRGQQYYAAATPAAQPQRAQSPQSTKSAPSILAQQFAFPHNPSGKDNKEYAFAGSNAYGSSSSQGSVPRSPAGARASPLSSRPSGHSHPIKPNEVGKPVIINDLCSRPLSRDEFRILNHHTQTNTLPQPFTKLQPSDVARIETAVRNSATASSSLHSARDPLNAAASQARKPYSFISSKHHSSATSVASSFSFASMPYRTPTSLGAVHEDYPASSSSGGVLPAKSLPRIHPGSHVAKFAFEPLLPDEVTMTVGERVTVVDVYDDGWCVVLRSGADVLMGAVPSHCFLDPSPDALPGFERIRPERKASLGVTVELEEHDSTGHSTRHDSVFSWSNF